MDDLGRPIATDTLRIMTSRSASLSGSSSNKTNPGSPKEIVTLVTAGKRIQAVLVGTRQLRLTAQIMLMKPKYYDPRKASQLRDVLNKHELVDDVMAGIKSIDRRTPGDEAEYAFICEVMGLRADAVEAFEKALAVAPDFDRVRLRFFETIAFDDTDKAIKILQCVSPSEG